MAGPAEQPKPSLVDYLVDYILDTDHAEDWNRIGLGETIAVDIAEHAVDYDLTDAEEAMLSTVLENFIQEQLGDAIDEKIAEQVESAREWRDAADSAINNN